MYVVITKNDIFIGKEISKINSKLDVVLAEQDFRRIGDHKIVQLDQMDYKFVRDLKRISQIPMEKLYKKDTTGTMMIIILVLQFITLVRAG